MRGILRYWGVMLVGTFAAFAADPAVPAVRVLPQVSFTLADFIAQTPKSAAGNFVMEIPEMVNLGRSVEARSVLEGKPIETIGQVAAEAAKNADGRSLRIVRSLIPCCVAHAKQYSVMVKFSGTAPVFKELTWLKLVGTMTYGNENGTVEPMILVREASETTAPVNPLLK